MTEPVSAWCDGTPHHLDPDAWALVCASFLGAGFRVSLPSRDRAAAAAHERSRVDALAELLGASIHEADWEAASRSNAEADIDLVGGWPRSYTEPPTMWIAATKTVQTRVATTVLLPEPLHSRPTAGLPMYSRLVEEHAVCDIAADCGLWADPDGRIVRSTAGQVLAQRADGSWATGTEVSSWTACETVRRYQASPDLEVSDLPGLRALFVIVRADDLRPLTLL